MTNYSIDDGFGNALTTGLSEHVAESTAQKIANERGESVWLYGEGEAEMKEVEPTINATLCNLATGEAIRPATADERAASVAAAISSEWRRVPSV